MDHGFSVGVLVVRAYLLVLGNFVGNQRLVMSYRIH